MLRKLVRGCVTIVWRTCQVLVIVILISFLPKSFNQEVKVEWQSMWTVVRTAPLLLHVIGGVIFGVPDTTKLLVDAGLPKIDVDMDCNHSLHEAIEALIQALDSSS